MTGTMIWPPAEEERKERSRESLDNEQKRRIMEEEIWLNYYNNYLLEHKAITEKEHLRMCNAIAIHCDQKRKRAEQEQ